MKIKAFPIFQLLISILLIMSCDNDHRPSIAEEKRYMTSNIASHIYNVELNEEDTKIYKRVCYIFPMIKSKITDIHVRLSFFKEGYCSISFFQGNINKIDPECTDLIKTKRLKLKHRIVEPHKTSYKEQMDILWYIRYLCEHKMNVDCFGILNSKYEDMGELNAEITELCDSIKKTIKPHDDRFEYSIAMSESTLGKDLRNIFYEYDIEFTNYMMYDSQVVPYDKYASQHKFVNTHKTPHVYLINWYHAKLDKRTFLYKQKRKLEDFIYNLRVKLGLEEESFSVE